MYLYTCIDARNTNTCVYVLIQEMLTQAALRYIYIIILVCPAACSKCCQIGDCSEFNHTA